LDKKNLIEVSSHWLLPFTAKNIQRVNKLNRIIEAIKMYAPCSFILFSNRSEKYVSNIANAFTINTKKKKDFVWEERGNGSEKCSINVYDIKFNSI